MRRMIWVCVVGGVTLLACSCPLTPHPGPGGTVTATPAVATPRGVLPARATSTSPLGGATEVASPVATAVPEPGRPAHELIHVESLSPILFDNESYKSARYWDVVLTNGDPLSAHTLGVRFQWQEDVYLNSVLGGFQTVTQLGEHQEELQLAAGSTQSFHVIVEDAFATTNEYSNGRNLECEMIAVDGVPVRAVEEIWQWITVELIPEVGEGCQYGEQVPLCQILVSNHDRWPHRVAGVFHFEFSYEYRGEVFQESRDWSMFQGGTVGRIKSGGSDYSFYEFGHPEARDLACLDSGKRLISLRANEVTLQLLDPYYCLTTTVFGCEKGPARVFEVSGCDLP